MSTRSADKRAGLTLVEVLVAGFLGALVLFLLVTLLLPTLRLCSQGATRVDLDQRGMIASYHLVSALRRTTRAGVAAGSSGPLSLLSIHQLDGTASGSKQNWSRDLTLFSLENRCLRKHTLPLEHPPTRAVTLPLDVLPRMRARNAPSLQIQDVKEFVVTIDPGPRVDFRLLFEKEGDILRLDRSVFLVNSSQ